MDRGRWYTEASHNLAIANGMELQLGSTRQPREKASVHIENPSFRSTEEHPRGSNKIVWAYDCAE